MADTPEEDGELTAWDARRKRLYKEAVRETLIEFGLNPSEPLEIQQDMAWLRNRRLLERSLAARIIGGALTLLITPGVVAAMVAAYFKGN